MPSQQIKRNRRRGSVALEFAIVAPIFFMLIFASVEFARVYMIQSAVENACFEAARRGIIPGGKSDVCKSHAESLLALAGVKNHTVTVEPSSIDASTESVTVTASVSLTAANGFGLSGMFQGKTMTKSVELPCQ